MLPYVVGVVLSIGVALFARWVGFDRDRAFYPTVLIVIASYYVLFAVMSGSVETEALRTEAETIASRTMGVKKVIDELTLGAQSQGTQAGGSPVGDAQGSGGVLQSDGTMGPAQAAPVGRRHAQRRSDPGRIRCRRGAHRHRHARVRVDGIRR